MLYRSSAMGCAGRRRCSLAAAAMLLLLLLPLPLVPCLHATSTELPCTLCATGAIVEYKYVLLESSGSVRAWQSGANNVLAVKLTEERLELFDTW